MHSSTSLDSSTLTFVLAGGEGKRLAPLTSRRPKSLVPFGAAFRIIDFTLSNCVNSGLDRAYLLTQFGADSVQRLIADSPWTTDFTCSPSRLAGGYRGTADALYQNLDLLRDQKPHNVLVLASDHIYKMDYRKLIRFHESHGGDATVATIRYPRRLAAEFGVLEVDACGKIVDFVEKPAGLVDQGSDSSTVLVSMGIYVFNSSALRRALLRDAGEFQGKHEFGSDVLPNLIRTDRVFAYDFTGDETTGGNYWRDVGTIDSYHRTHMDLLLKSQFDPYDDARWPVYASGRELSVRNETLDYSWVVDSIVSPDAHTSEATILQSVIFPSVYVGRAAIVQDSVLMRDVHVGRGARIRRAILDEGVVIADGDRIGYDTAEDRRRFFVTRDGVAVVEAANVEASRGNSSPASRREQILHAR